MEGCLRRMILNLWLQSERISYLCDVVIVVVVVYIEKGGGLLFRLMYWIVFCMIR